MNDPEDLIIKVMQIILNCRDKVNNVQDFQPYRDLMIKTVEEYTKDIIKQRNELIECVKLAIDLQRKDPKESIIAYNNFIKVATEVFKYWGYE